MKVQQTKNGYYVTENSKVIHKGKDASEVIQWAIDHVGKKNKEVITKT